MGDGEEKRRVFRACHCGKGGTWFVLSLGDFHETHFIIVFKQKAVIEYWNAAKVSFLKHWLLS